MTEMPTRRRFSRVHAIAGVVAFAVILVLLSSSLVAELMGTPATITLVKTSIAWALLVLVPALAATGASGFAMAALSPKGLLAVKLRRMRVIAANGVLVLVPAVLFLAWKAKYGEFDAGFIAVQLVEFAAGSLNVALMGLNIRDGLRLTRRTRQSGHRALAA
jgi:hypothetical protein